MKEYLSINNLCSWTLINLAEILVLAGTAGAGGMAPPTSTGISDRLKCVQGHSSAVNIALRTHLVPITLSQKTGILPSYTSNN